jgi:hypothetical protein
LTPVGEKKSTADRKPIDVMVMFRMLVLQSLYDLSDEHLEYQVRDRLPFTRFLAMARPVRCPGRLYSVCPGSNRTLPASKLRRPRWLPLRTLAAAASALRARPFACATRTTSNSCPSNHASCAAASLPMRIIFVLRSQPRALGRKVSNEFTVPVCRLHHREIHRHGDEAAWWTGLKIDPVPIAFAFWGSTHRDGAFRSRNERGLPVASTKQKHGPASAFLDRSRIGCDR